MRSLRRVLKLGATLTLSLCLSLVGCGNQPVAVPDLNRTASPGGFSRVFVGIGGDVKFTYRTNWALIPRDPPGVATVASGGASLTVWAYRAVAKVKSNRAAVLARDRLLASLRRRDPSFVLTGASVYPFFGAAAVEIDGRATIGGRSLVVRSVHIYRGLGEYVVDMLGDPPVFNAVNVEVFQPLLLSLRLRGRPPLPNGSPRPGAPPSPTARPSPGPQPSPAAQPTGGR